MRASALQVMSAVVGAAVLSSGCAEKPSVGAMKAFERARDALRAGDHGAVYDLMSKKARADAAADVKKRIRAAAEVQVRMGKIAGSVLGFDPAEAAALPPREAYVMVVGGSKASSAKLAAGVGAAATVAGGVADAGAVKCRATPESATVTAALPGGKTVQVKLVREDGEWRLASPPEAWAAPEKPEAKPGAGEGPEAPK